MRGLDHNKRLFQALKQGELKGFLELVSSNKTEYFLGIRNEYVNIYYKGGSLLKISAYQKMDKFKFEVNENYFGNSKELIPQKDDINQWLHVIPKFKTYIKEYQNGGDPNVRIKNEKMVQQNILSNINSSLNSDYYITDMEYSCPGIGYGRFDYIAIKKKKTTGKYGLALIELKYGSNAFGTSVKKDNDKIKSYGSGILGHSFNFSRFVFGVSNKESFQREKVPKTGYDTLEFLRKETINILKNKSELGLIDLEANGMSGILEEENIDINNVETLLICVSCSDEDKAINTISRYFGYIEPAKYNVKKLKEEGDIPKEFSLKYFVTKEKEIQSLKENQFIDLQTV